jgi:hypothetical protein
VSEERWIMISDGTPQMLWVGKTTLDDEKIEEITAAGKFVLLNEARTLRTVMVPHPEGFVQSNQLTPAGICRGAITVRVRPLAYIWPDEDEHTMKPLMQQVESCSQSEMKHRAKEAGITLAGGKNITPDGMRSIPGGIKR